MFGDSTSSRLTMHTASTRTHSKSRSCSVSYPKSPHRVRITDAPPEIITVPNRRDDEYARIKAMPHHRSSSRDHNTVKPEVDAQTTKRPKEKDRIYPEVVERTSFRPQQARAGQEQQRHGSVGPYVHRDHSPFPGVAAWNPPKELYHGHMPPYTSHSRRHSIDAYGTRSVPTQYPQPAQRHYRSSSTTLSPASASPRDPPPQPSLFARLGQRFTRPRHTSLSTPAPTIVVVLPTENATYHHRRGTTRYA